MFDNLSERLEGAFKSLKGEGKIRSVYDPCCGTGGMLTIGKQWIHENINEKLKIELFGQELNDVTYSICKSDFLMADENPENIKGPYSSLSNDKYSDRKFEYMITNPPFGTSWSADEEFVKNEANQSNGRFLSTLPRTSEGSLLFLQHLIDKMEPNGSRIGIVFNGSACFTGDAGSGESEIRKWVIENDFLETVIMLPDKMFFNTGIMTFIWILDNKKSNKRKNKIQLIDASKKFKLLKRNLGEKNKEFLDDHIKDINNLYEKFENNDESKIFENNFFGYVRTTIDRPLTEKGKIIFDKKKKIKIDKSKRYYEKVPLNFNFQEY